MKNYGLIIEKPKKEDYFFGSDTKINFEVLQENGNWKPFVPVYEYQNTNFETMACVSFSALNCLEIMHKRKYGYEMNWSDRFTSKVSGTTTRGNSLRNVAESIRKTDGIIRQDLWPNVGKNWQEWYAQIPPNIRGQALNNLDKYFIQYEWVGTDKNTLREALKTAPVQIGIYAYGKKVNGVYQRTLNRPNHLITLLSIGKDGVYECFDHYLGNEYRLLASDYFIGFAMKFNINKITMDFYQRPNDNKIYQFGDDGLYHWIISEKTFKKLYGEFSEVNIIKKDITDMEIGESIGLII